ncbi:hypothetical protein CDEST_05891 [Colletotrichum destructivum]|uniref:Uncharacterized protein n=1 Tax=Colletotrichum destructivum TaxID=34406 RepID=A0AAX4IBV4_9PEZI|nr:hypothetical protein CDEST_05891 [Colletotrichum destructivum]
MALLKSGRPSRSAWWSQRSKPSCREPEQWEGSHETAGGQQPTPVVLSERGGTVIGIRHATKRPWVFLSRQDEPYNVVQQAWPSHVLGDSSPEPVPCTGCMQTRLFRNAGTLLAFPRRVLESACKDAKGTAK